MVIPPLILHYTEKTGTSMILEKKSYTISWTLWDWTYNGECHLKGATGHPVRAGCEWLTTAWATGGDNDFLAYFPKSELILPTLTNQVQYFFKFSPFNRWTLLKWRGYPVYLKAFPAFLTSTRIWDGYMCDFCVHLEYNHSADGH